MKTVERQTARVLRAAGWSIKEIERELRVSRSSVSRWVRDVDLQPEQRAALEERIRIYCHLHADHTGRRQVIEKFWLETLELPQGSLGKSSVNVYSKYSAKKRTNRLPNGTCRLTVNSTRIVQTIFGSLQAFGAFSRPAWID